MSPARVGRKATFLHQAKGVHMIVNAARTSARSTNLADQMTALQCSPLTSLSAIPTMMV